MKSNRTKIVQSSIYFLSLMILLGVSLSPTLSLAATGSGSSGTTGSGSSVTCPSGQICNPLKYTSIQAIISALLTAVEYIGGIICALWIIWAGFLFVKAQGNPEKIDEAKSTITHAVIGTAIILGAGVILTIITNTVAAIKS